MGIFSLIWNWFVLVLIVAAAVFFAAGLWKLRRQPADDAAGRVSRTGRCGSSSPCCCSCRASTASANFDADADLPVFFSGNGRPQAVPFAFSPGSLPGDFFSGRRDRGRNGGESRVNDKLSRRLSSPNAGRMGCLMGILYVNRYFVCNFNKCAVNNKLLT